jgi:predicted phage replisome organizer/uncharacterized phage protein (TIGR02220 family)
MDNKKYYYLKLKDNFFESDAMIVLEAMQDGYLYSNILLKLYLRSLKNDGKLMFNERIPYNSTILAQVVRHNVGVVEKAMKIFSELELIEVLDNGSIYMLAIQNFIGSSSSEADRIRNYRAKVENEKGVQMLQQMNDICTPEIELELEKELDLEKDIDKKNPCHNDKENREEMKKEIIDYLNYKLSSRYKAITKTNNLIKARMKEGFTIEDFKQVIDKKFDEWKGTEYEKYLRPETLFGNKFEGYLNQKVIMKQSKYSEVKNEMNSLLEKYQSEERKMLHE